jgi:hypothetical protein
MAEPSTLYVGLDVHKDHIAVAHVCGSRDEDVVYVGPIGTREADLDKLLRRLHGHAARVVVAYEAGPCGRLTRLDDHLRDVAATWRLRPRVDAYQGISGIGGHNEPLQ